MFVLPDRCSIVLACASSGRRSGAEIRDANCAPSRPQAPPDPCPLVVAVEPQAVGSPVLQAPTVALAAPALDPEAEADDGLVREFLLFVREEKRWVVAPMLVTLVALGVLIVFAEGSAIAPFIYVMF
jgi:hypothetical protein